MVSHSKRSCEGDKQEIIKKPKINKKSSAGKYGVRNHRTMMEHLECINEDLMYNKDNCENGWRLVPKDSYEVYKRRRDDRNRDKQENGVSSVSNSDEDRSANKEKPVKRKKKAVKTKKKDKMSNKASRSHKKSRSESSLSSVISYSATSMCSCSECADYSN